MKELVASGKGCLIIEEENHYYKELIFNQYSYLLDQLKTKPEIFIPAVYKKWLKGYSWKRTYDEDYNDKRTDSHYAADPEPRFLQLRAYLEENGVNYRNLTIGEIEDFEDMTEETEYCSDRYYGSDVYTVKFIRLEKLDEWIAKKLGG